MDTNVYIKYRDAVALQTFIDKAVSTHSPIYNGDDRVTAFNDLIAYIQYLNGNYELPAEQIYNIEETLLGGCDQPEETKRAKAIKEAASIQSALISEVMEDVIYHETLPAFNQDDYLGVLKGISIMDARGEGTIIPIEQRIKDNPFSFIGDSLFDWNHIAETMDAYDYKFVDDVYHWYVENVQDETCYDDEFAKMSDEERIKKYNEIMGAYIKEQLLWLGTNKDNLSFQFLNY